MVCNRQFWIDGTICFNRPGTGQDLSLHYTHFTNGFETCQITPVTHQFANRSFPIPDQKLNLWNFQNRGPTIFHMVCNRQFWIDGSICFNRPGTGHDELDCKCLICFNRPGTGHDLSLPKYKYLNDAGFTEPKTKPIAGLRLLA